MAESTSQEPASPPRAAAPSSSAPAPVSPISSAQPPQPLAPTTPAAPGAAAQVPYAPYPYAQPTFAPPPAVVVPFSKAWHWAKVGLTSASLVFAIIALCLSIALASNIDSLYVVSLTIVWVAPVTIAAILWDAAEFITLCACGKRHGPATALGIHPGAHVGVDLILFLSAAITTAVSAMAVVSINAELQYCEEEMAESRSSRYSYYYDYCDDQYGTLSSGFYRPAVEAIAAFLGLMTIVHFVLFVRACVETNQRNKLRPPVVFVPSQMYYGSPAAGAPGTYYPMMPPQAHLGAPPGATSNEKAAAPQIANLGGFYAPAAPAPTTQP